MEWRDDRTCASLQINTFSVGIQKFSFLTQPNTTLRRSHNVNNLEVGHSGQFTYFIPRFIRSSQIQKLVNRMHHETSFDFVIFGPHSPMLPTAQTGAFQKPGAFIDNLGKGILKTTFNHFPKELLSSMEPWELCAKGSRTFFYLENK